MPWPNILGPRKPEAPVYCCVHCDDFETTNWEDAKAHWSSHDRRLTELEAERHSLQSQIDKLEADVKRLHEQKRQLDDQNRKYVAKLQEITRALNL